MLGVYQWDTTWSPVYASTDKDREKKIARLRKVQDQSSDSVHRTAEVCVFLPDTISAYHGYHRECYQRFKMNLDRLSKDKIRW